MVKWEDELGGRIENFVAKSKEKIANVTAQNLIETNAINPFLVAALGMELKTVARFYVYQRIQRGIVTSFGADMEFIVKGIAGGKRGEWWDVVTEYEGMTYYISVKSGPSDMDKDQVEHFADRATKEMKKDKSAYPIIGMGYGRSLWPIIGTTLKNKGLSPEKHAIFGKRLYEILTKDPNGHKKILTIIKEAEKKILGKKTITDLIEEKVEEIAKEFQKKYRTVGDLIDDTF